MNIYYPFQLRFMAVVLCVVLVMCGVAVAQLRIVTTTTDLRSLATSVGGDLVSVSSIGTGREDVHMLAAKPSFMVQANRANLWIRMGCELEIGFEPLVIEGARNPDIHVGQRGHLDASAGIGLLEVPVVPVDRSMGDIHPMGNPHYHLDPFNGRIMARNIRERLIDLDPANAETYKTNCYRFLQCLDRAMFGDALVDTLDADQIWSAHTAGTLDSMIAEQGLVADGWYALMKPYAGKRIVTYHKSWVYFAKRFALEIVDDLEPKPGIPPTAKHLASLVPRIKALDVSLILMEPYYSRKAPDLVASRTDAVVVEVGNMVDAEPVANDYITMIDTIVQRIAQAFEAQSK